VIAGGHGKIALLLERLPAERGDQTAGLIRNPAHAADVHKAGAEAAVCDLEAASAGDVAELLSGADAVVFAADAGTGSGAGRTDSADRAAAVLMADAAGRAGSAGSCKSPRWEPDVHGTDRRRGVAGADRPGLFAVEGADDTAGVTTRERPVSGRAALGMEPGGADEPSGVTDEGVPEAVEELRRCIVTATQ
jgi:NAD(P)H-binding